MDYAMQLACDVPPFAFSTITCPSTANPLGVRARVRPAPVRRAASGHNSIVHALHRRAWHCATLESQRRGRAAYGEMLKRYTLKKALRRVYIIHNPEVAGSSIGGAMDCGSRG